MDDVKKYTPNSDTYAVVGVVVAFFVWVACFAIYTALFYNPVIAAWVAIIPSCVVATLIYDRGLSLERAALSRRHGAEARGE